MSERGGGRKRKERGENAWGEGVEEGATKRGQVTEHAAMLCDVGVSERGGGRKRKEGRESASAGVRLPVWVCSV